LICFDGNRGIYSHRLREVWRESSWICTHGSSEEDELQRLYELWNNTLIFPRLGFLYLSGGSIWVNALPDTLLKSDQRSLR